MATDITGEIVALSDDDLWAVASVVYGRLGGAIAATILLPEHLNIIAW
ncbi:MAG: hypothetical protein QNJ51_27950 [Calothrix sp. MO_167.B12]|nr:hypothetical protein [Calothrix sp. MO_167.B12]